MANLNPAEVLLAKTLLPREFPRLVEGVWDVKSNQCLKHNCIAYAMGDEGRWWWPLYRYWPIANRTCSTNSFVSAFATCGFSSCPDGSVEAAKQKVVLYCLGGVPTHAARQIVVGEHAGRWRSKLGRVWDIIHEQPEHVENNTYGTVHSYFSRDVSTWGVLP
jgi:hypothetical protein